jgi:hypothetical protein
MAANYQGVTVATPLLLLLLLLLPHNNDDGAFVAAASDFNNQPALKLAVMGAAEVVWDKAKHSCPEPYHLGQEMTENGDSVPIAWHNPLTNVSYLISATYRGTYASIGPTLSGALEHDCSRRVYPGLLDSLAPVGPPAGPNCTGAAQPGTCARYQPSSYANFQWLQSVHVFPNGTGFALVHNEMHGELSGNRSLCDHIGGKENHSCIVWSTDLGMTVDGGHSWQLMEKPVFALPRRYVYNNPHEGYGALGPVLHENDFYYGHVYRLYAEGAGPPGLTDSGVCTWRTPDPFDASSYRGWNGSAWSTRWLDPYTVDSAVLAPSELWRYTCATIDTGGDGSSHPQPRKFAQASPGEWIPTDWPSHVMVGWPGGRLGNGSKAPPYSISYSLGPAKPANVGGSAPFTAWAPSQYLSVADWVDPQLVGRGWEMRYPTLIDHDSPFGLIDGDHSAEVKSEGLSYGLVGNASLHLYFVVAGHSDMTMRLPVAWIDANAATPPGPFVPTAPPLQACYANESTVRSIAVSGAGTPAVNGEYRRVVGRFIDQMAVFELDPAHQLYREGGLWRIGHPSVGLDYVGMPNTEDMLGPPAYGSAWSVGTLAVRPAPAKLTCVKRGT